ncbi:MAG: caspase family protein [Cyclobacteriaceae bacterium]
MKKIFTLTAIVLMNLGLMAQSSEVTSSAVDLGPLLFKMLNAKAEEKAVPEVPVKNEELVAVGETKIVLSSDVDVDIPVFAKKNPNAFAVVIGNAQYTNTSNVDYAVHDARAMKEYLINTMGFYPENVFLEENATQTDFRKWFGNESSHKGRLYNLAYENIETNTDLFIFYAGHGAPDPNTKSGYFLPADCEPNYIDVTAYPAELLFSNINKIGAKSTTIVMDACFSGNGVITGLSAVAIKPKDFGDIENGIVITSSSGTQPSAWYEEKNHGLFSYYFLKALREPATDVDGNGEVTIDEIYTYVENMVPRKARGLRNLDQNPTIRGIGRDRVLFTRESGE